MPFRHRRPLLAAVVTLIALGAGASSAGASIVYSHAGQIWTMNDNGSGRQLLLTPDDAGLTFKDKDKGNDSLGNPSIAPDGTTLMFTGSTRRNHFTRVG